MRLKSIVYPLLILFLLSCNQGAKNDELFNKFQNPDATARPMVRWWWNDDRLEVEEIKRELAVLKDAGIGGVEINPIAMLPENDNLGIKVLEWGSPEWSKMVKAASLEAQKNGMIVDLLVGSGWPFGGEFLQENERIQRIRVREQVIKPNEKIDINIKNILDEIKAERGAVSIHSVKLIPDNIHSINEIIDLTEKIKNSKLEFRADSKERILTIVYVESDFREVQHGALGAGGPVMDHFKEESVIAYINRLKVIEEHTGILLTELVRALFVDSIELSGSNWTNEMAKIFRERNGYELTPYLPFVLKADDARNEYGISDELLEKIRRVRYDYNNTVIALFLENFVQNYQKFCTENKVLCRYQAYGTPDYMGIFQGNTMVDIPECNNWLYSRNRDETASSEYTWAQNHGYMLWAKAASTGAHITGRNITSCEAMTNTGGNFRTSLETIKQSDDMNFIIGVNHSVLHGYNYSSPEAEFPGWYRFGTYFNERNTWWKYFRKWTDYNARLSSLFQNADPVADIAVLSRIRDTWSESGRLREPLHLEPWYYVRLWEPISRLGGTSDYISQPILEDAIVEGKELVCGKMRYKALFLADVSSLTPEAAITVNKFAMAGGKIVFVGEKPKRSLSLKDAEENDKIVIQSIGEILDLENVAAINAPRESEDFTVWTQQLLNQIGLETDVIIHKPKSCLYSTKYTNADKEIYFFTNSDRKKAITFEASFNAGNKTPYIWLPETGERFLLSYPVKNKLQIELDALESALIIFENRKIDLPLYKYNEKPIENKELTAIWDVKFEHTNGDVFEREMRTLIDFKDAEDSAIMNFAGDVTYSTRIENDESFRFITLKEVNQAVSELFVNGQQAGVKWYGNHTYDISSFLQPGENKIEIKLTTTLANYARSLKENPVTAVLTNRYKEPFSAGLTGVELAK
jgi:hypothetical protein